MSGLDSLDLWWAIPGVLAGMPMPLIHPHRREQFGGPLEQFRDDLTLLAEAGIGAVVSLLNIPGDAAVYTAAGFGYLSLPIPDGGVPSLAQFRGFLRFVQEQRAMGRAVAVHCAAGLGRTGTILAGYLVANGATAQSAIARIRTARPGAIETRQQVQFLIELQDALRG